MTEEAPRNRKPTPAWVPLGVVGIALGGTVALYFALANREPDLTPEQQSARFQAEQLKRREDLARSIQDNLRDEGHGKVFVEVRGEDHDVLHFWFDGCTDEKLEALALAPTVKRKLGDAGFFWVQCLGGKPIHL